jgi:hypothetical protein
LGLESVWTTWRREKFRPYRDSNSDPSAVQSAASRYTGSMIGVRSHLSLSSSPLRTGELNERALIWAFVPEPRNYTTLLQPKSLFAVARMHQQFHLYYKKKTAVKRVFNSSRPEGTNLRLGSYFFPHLNI